MLQAAPWPLTAVAVTGGTHFLHFKTSQTVAYRCLPTISDCGQLKAIAMGEPRSVYLCHCQACQRRSGSVVQWPRVGEEPGSAGGADEGLRPYSRQRVGWVERSETHDPSCTMTAYRRNLVAGGTYFFTLNLENRRLRLLTDNIGLLRAAFRYTRSRHPFTIEAIVILPDHLHALWTLPAGDRDFSTRWRLIKTMFSRGLHPSERLSASRSRKRKRGIWQRRFWEHTIRDDGDFARHVDYIHFNPVKHGHVERVQDWQFSSFQRMVRLGSCPPDWVCPGDESGSGFGER